MAARTSNKKGSNKNNGKKKVSGRRGTPTKQSSQTDIAGIIGIVLFCIGILLFSCNFIPSQGGFLKACRTALRGLGGQLCLLIPIMLCFYGVVLVFFRNSVINSRRMICGIILFFLFETIFQVFCVKRIGAATYLDFLRLSYEDSARSMQGGGFLGAILAWPLCKALDVWGSMIVLVFSTIIVLVIMTGFSFGDLGPSVSEWVDDLRENMQLRREEREALREAKEEELLNREADEAMERAQKKKKVEKEDFSDEMPAHFGQEKEEKKTDRSAEAGQSVDNGKRKKKKEPVKAVEPVPEPQKPTIPEDEPITGNFRPVAGKKPKKQIPYTGAGVRQYNKDLYIERDDEFTRKPGEATEGKERNGRGFTQEEAEYAFLHGLNSTMPDSSPYARPQESTGGPSLGNPIPLYPDKVKTEEDPYEAYRSKQYDTGVAVGYDPEDTAAPELEDIGTAAGDPASGVQPDQKLPVAASTVAPVMPQRPVEPVMPQESASSAKPAVPQRPVPPVEPVMPQKPTPPVAPIPPYERAWADSAQVTENVDQQSVTGKSYTDTTPPEEDAGPVPVAERNDFDAVKPLEQSPVTPAAVVEESRKDREEDAGRRSRRRRGGRAVTTATVAAAVTTVGAAAENLRIPSAPTGVPLVSAPAAPAAAAENMLPPREHPTGTLPSSIPAAGVSRPQERAEKPEPQASKITPISISIPFKETNVNAVRGPAVPQPVTELREGRLDGTPMVPLKRDMHDSQVQPVKQEYVKPSLDLLVQSRTEEDPDQRAKDENGMKKLLATLESFGVQARGLTYTHGPAITRYEIQPAPGVKVSRIVNLVDDIALNMASTGVRIEAPIPGKAAVGIEVPNESISMVTLRDVLDTPEMRKETSPTAVALGKGISGKPVIADMAKMPHVLIAGATGSGKSVCINTIINSIIYRASPDEVRLILVDPKVVELSVYNGIPHLLIPVVTDPKKASAALDWAVVEMEHRYKRFESMGVRDIRGYNAAIGPDEPKMYKIIVIIDELADLMMVAPGEVEESICRLAQLARAAGIHLVIATQRPSVNVITGVIKANIPSRIAFAVSSQIDSRTILDSGGAEKLLGKGDMLYAPQGANKPTRVQGCFVSDGEVERIVSAVKAQHQAEYSDDVMERINSAAEAEKAQESGEPASGADSQVDEMLAKAIELAVESGQVSISMLQRRLRIGYARAGRLVDEMTLRGITAESEGNAKPRQVLISREDWKKMQESGDL